MKKKLSPKEITELLTTLEKRFRKHMERHKGLSWDKVQSRINAYPTKLWSLNEMEITGGEPDVVGFDKKSGEFIFMDCSPETPKDRRNACYDKAAQKARKEHAPEFNAMDMATEMGIEILTEEQYADLQKLGKFDLKTSSWLKTPPEIRKHGGAIFGDRRYEHVFTYHNGAQSYYAVRGFRSVLYV